jgi:hypothetical protein
MPIVQTLICVLLGHRYVNVELTLGKLDPEPIMVRECVHCHKVLVPIDKIIGGP